MLKKLKTAVYKEMHKKVFKIFYWFTNMFVNIVVIYKAYNMCNVCNVYIQNGAVRTHLDLKRQINNTINTTPVVRKIYIYYQL